MKILKSILNYIPLATFIIFVVTDGIFSLTSALIFVISTIGLLINWKRKKTEMKNWENSSLQNWIKRARRSSFSFFVIVSLWYNRDIKIGIYRIILPTSPIFQGLQSLVWWNDMYFPLFLPLWDKREGNKGNFFLVIACHLVEKPWWISLSFSGGVSIDIHSGTDIWVS